MWSETKSFQTLLHIVALVLPHEPIVDVHCHHLLLSQSYVEESCADSTVNATTHQGLQKRGY